MYVFVITVYSMLHVIPKIHMYVFIITVHSMLHVIVIVVHSIFCHITKLHIFAVALMYRPPLSILCLFFLDLGNKLLRSMYILSKGES